MKKLFYYWEVINDAHYLFCYNKAGPYYAHWYPLMAKKEFGRGWISRLFMLNRTYQNFSSFEDFKMTVEKNAKQLEKTIISDELKILL